MIPHRTIFSGLRGLVWRAERPDFGSERSDLGSERRGLGSERLNLGSERPDLGLRGLIWVLTA